MPRHCGPIALADVQMKMECQLARGSIGDVADERCDFDLFAHRNLQIILLVPIEVQQHDVAQCTNRRDLRREYVFAGHKSLETGQHSLAGLEDDCEGPLAVVLCRSRVCIECAEETMGSRVGSRSQRTYGAASANGISRGI